MLSQGKSDIPAAAILTSTEEVSDTSASTRYGREHQLHSYGRDEDKPRLHEEASSAMSTFTEEARNDKENRGGILHTPIPSSFLSSDHGEFCS